MSFSLSAYVESITCPITHFLMARSPFNKDSSLYKRFLLTGGSIGNDSVILITGGANGLGLEIVRLLASKTVKKVIIVDIVPPKCDILPDSKKITFVRCDISDYNKVCWLYTHIEKKYGPVSILINNAGITNIQTLLTVSDERLARIIKVNFMGAYFVTSKFLPGIIESESGYIVNVASVLGEATPARLAAYGASKGSLIAFHNWLCVYLKNLKHCRVKLLLVCPGKIHTKMFEEVYTPSKLLAPDVDPTKLASLIVNSMECNKETTIRAPYYTNLLPMFRKLDWPYFWLFKKLSGMNTVTAI